MSSTDVTRAVGSPSSGDPRWPRLHPLARWLEGLVRLLDSALPIPGTKLRVGLDPVVGLLAPGAGDAIGGAVSLSLLFLALQYRLPVWVIGKMVGNIAVDAAVGGIPFLGDAFDVIWKSNERNLQLLHDHRSRELRARMPVRYWLAVIALFVLAAACLLAPIVLVIWLAGQFIGKAS
jgi:hypothetical protein